MSEVDITQNRRSSRRSSASSAVSNKSEHPAAYPIDVSGWEASKIESSLDELGPRMDFVDVPLSTIRDIFVSKACVTRIYYGNPNQILYPPPALKRSGDQIREFYRLGRKQQLERIEKYRDYQIIKADTTTRNATTVQDKTTGPKNNESDQPAQLCCGFTLKYIQQMQTKEKGTKEKYMDGFKHVVRNSYRTRAELSKKSPDADPDDLDYWSKHFVPPVVGAVTNGNNVNEVRWFVEEQQRSVGVDQFGCHSIHAMGCERGKVVKQDLCAKCLERKIRLLDKFTSAVNMSILQPKKKKAKSK